MLNWEYNADSFESMSVGDFECHVISYFIKVVSDANAISSGLIIIARNEYYKPRYKIKEV